jgi:hypothetical protein
MLEDLPVSGHSSDSPQNRFYRLSFSDDVMLSFLLRLSQRDSVTKCFVSRLIQQTFLPGSNILRAFNYLYKDNNLRKRLRVTLTT